MARPRKNLDDDATVDRLRDAAMADFSAKGFAATRLEDVARRAGIGRASLLYHFKSKDALYASVVTHTFAGLGRALGSALETRGSRRVRLEALVEGFQGFLCAHPHAPALLLREVLDGRGPGLALLRRHGIPLLRAVDGFLVEKAGSRPTAREKALPSRAALMHLVAGSLVAAAAGPLRADLWGPDDPTRAMARLLWGGL